MARRSIWRTAVALLAIASTVAFVAGVAIEDSETGEGAEEAAEAPAAAGGETAAEGEGQEEGESEGRAEESNEEREAAERSEDLFGVNPESTWTVAAAVLLSLLVAGAVWRWGTPFTLVGAIAFGVVFAALDVREAVNQADESRGWLVGLALVVAALHAGVALVAASVLARRVPAMATA